MIELSRTIYTVSNVNLFQLIIIELIFFLFAGDNHVLNMRLIDHLFDDMLVEQAEVRIILPEGATNIELSTPYPVQREQDGKHFTYLDTTGTYFYAWKNPFAKYWKLRKLLPKNWEKNVEMVPKKQGFFCHNTRSFEYFV